MLIMSCNQIASACRAQPIPRILWEHAAAYLMHSTRTQIIRALVIAIISCFRMHHVCYVQPIRHTSQLHAYV